MKLTTLKSMVTLIIGMMAVFLFTFTVSSVNETGDAALINTQGDPVGEFNVNVQGNNSALSININEPYCLTEVSYTANGDLVASQTYTYQENSCISTHSTSVTTLTSRSDLVFGVNVSYVDPSINDGLEPLPQTATLTNPRRGASTYWEFELDGQTLLAWCLDRFKFLFDEGNYQVDVVAIDEQNVISDELIGPALWLTANTDLFEATVIDLQSAMWLMFGVSQQAIIDLHPEVDIDLAQSVADTALEEGEGFQPTCGNTGYSAVVLVPTNTYPANGGPAQPILLPLPFLVPCEELTPQTASATVTIKVTPPTDVPPPTDIPTLVPPTVGPTETPIPTATAISERTFWICHVPPSHNEIKSDVPESSLNGHLQHGDWIISPLTEEEKNRCLFGEGGASQIDRPR